MNKDILKRSLYGFWLGFSLSAVGFGFPTWQYWFVMIPTLALVTIFNSTNK